MTNALTAARLEVAECLTAVGITASEYIPEVVNPPLVIISAATPYLSESPTNPFGSLEVRLLLRMVAAQDNNEDATEALEQLIVDTCLALSSDWSLDNVGQPFGYEVNGALFLAADAVITASIQIEKEVM